MYETTTKLDNIKDFFLRNDFFIVIIPKTYCALFWIGSRMMHSEENFRCT